MVTQNGKMQWTQRQKSLNEYNTFKDNGKIKFMDNYKRIIVHFVFAVKHDFCHNARLAAGGHLADSNTEGTYSGVVSLCSQCIAIATAELNNLKIIVGNISSTYLEITPKKRYTSLLALNLDHLKDI
jgi:hypothetical protein